MSEWKEYYLGDICSFRTGKLNSNAAVLNGRYPFFTCAPNPLTIDVAAFNQEAIILAGNNAEGNFSINYYNGEFNAYQRTYVITANDTICAKYLFYSLSQYLKEFKALSRGTATKFLTTSILNTIKLTVPPLSEQKKIAAVLSALDEKIETNRKINARLEELAQAIFKSWFIDFEPFGGQMPNDWKTGALSDMLFLVKKTIKASEVGTLPYLPIDKLPINRLGIEEYDNSSNALSSLLRFSKNDILIGAMRVYFHRVIIAPFNGVTRSTCFVLRPHQEIALPYLLLLCNQDSTIDYANTTSKGTTMPYAVWEKGLGDMGIIIPASEVLIKFSSLVMPLIYQIRDGYKELQCLAELRDTLLPKLMSGELKPE